MVHKQADCAAPYSSGSVGRGMACGLSRLEHAMFFLGTHSSLPSAWPARCTLQGSEWEHENMGTWEHEANTRVLWATSNRGTFGNQTPAPLPHGTALAPKSTREGCLTRNHIAWIIADLALRARCRAGVCHLAEARLKQLGQGGGRGRCLHHSGRPRVSTATEQRAVLLPEQSAARTPWPHWKGALLEAASLSSPGSAHRSPGH